MYRMQDVVSMKSEDATKPGFLCSIVSASLLSLPLSLRLSAVDTFIIISAAHFCLPVSHRSKVFSSQHTTSPFIAEAYYLSGLTPAQLFPCAVHTSQSQGARISHVSDSHVQGDKYMEWPRMLQVALSSCATS